MSKYLLLITILISEVANSTNFTLDKFNIEIQSNFLGEELLLFGKKESERNIIIIFEGEKNDAKLTSKIKEGIFWSSKTVNLENIPSFFAIFSTPKISLNEIFLLPLITERHNLVKNYSEELYKIRIALKSKGLYYEEELDNADGSLFFKKFKIPDNIPAGDIGMHLYEISNNRVISSDFKKLTIEKKGFSNKLENLLYQQSFYYVFILIIFSMIFSLISNLIFRKK